MKFKIIYIILLMFLFSCLSYAKTKSACRCSYKQDIKELNGIYENKQDSTSTTLIGELYNGKTKKIDHLEEMILELEFNDHEILIKGYFEDSLIHTGKVKGHWNGNQFALKRHRNFIGIPPVYFFCSESKTYIGIDIDNNLKFNNGTEGFGMILFFAAGNSDYSCISFKKSDTNQ